MISVCIATYNGATYIKRQLLSILSQLSADDEVVISDDKSTDKTIEAVRALGSPLIHIYENTGKHGYTPNFENALRHATGDYIFLADQDDEWQADKVATMLKALETADFAVSDAVVVDANSNLIADSYFSLRHPYKSLAGNIYKFGYLGCCMAFRRTILAKALPFPADHAICTHDNWLFLVGKAFYRTTVLNDKLIRYYRRGDNASTGGLAPSTTVAFKIKYRLYLLYQLIRHIG